MSEISWDLFHEQVSACTMCPLHATVTNKVPGQGDIHSPLMLIGEGPGQREDEEGIAFVGAAGQLLTKMLSAIYLPRDRVYICNVVKSSSNAAHPITGCRQKRKCRPACSICACRLRLCAPKSSFFWVPPRSKRPLDPTTTLRMSAGDGMSAKGSG